MVSIVKAFDAVNFKDGSLREISINEMTVSEWNELILYISKIYPTQNNLNLNNPINIYDLLKDSKNNYFCLKIGLKKDISVDFITYFDEKGFDILGFNYDPQEVNLSSFHEIYTFMKTIGDFTKKNIFITPENCYDDVMLEYCNNLSKFYYINNNHKILIEGCLNN